MTGQTWHKEYDGVYGLPLGDARYSDGVYRRFVSFMQNSSFLIQNSSF